MSTEQEVIALVAKRTGRPESSITPEKTFYQLGIDGDDAVELIDGQNQVTKNEEPGKNQVTTNQVTGRCEEID